MHQHRRFTLFIDLQYPRRANTAGVVFLTTARRVEIGALQHQPQATIWKMDLFAHHGLELQPQWIILVKQLCVDHNQSFRAKNNATASVTTTARATVIRNAHGESIKGSLTFIP